MTATTLLQEMTDYVRAHRDSAMAFQQLDDQTLTRRPQPNGWNILECMEHLNRYGNFYLPEIQQQMERSRYPATVEFRSGWLGNYFVNSIKPDARQRNMNTFKSMNPLGDRLDRNVLVIFIQQQDKLLKLLKSADSVNLMKAKTGISITNFIRIRLGDTFRFVIYHQERHLRQAKGLLP